MGYFLSTAQKIQQAKFEHNISMPSTGDLCCRGIRKTRDGDKNNRLL